uniref:Claudin n=1 Tax=Arion vulgaris TaxID=1028688 RepID=A0A0B6ZVA7_9EUPU
MKLRDIKLVSDDGVLGGTSKIWKLSILLTFIGLVMYVIGFSTDWWCQLDNEDYAAFNNSKINAHFGLWRKCITITINGSEKPIVDGCEDMDNDDSYKPAAKTLCSMGLILGIFGLPAAIFAGCSQSPRLMTFGGVLTVSGAALAATGCIVCIGKAKDEDDRLEAEYSSILAIIGSALLVVGGILQLLSIKSGYHSLA